MNESKMPEAQNYIKCRKIPVITNYFFGYAIDYQGISPDPQKAAAILAMKLPTSVTELRSFMGTVNQITKFSPSIAQISKPLMGLVSSKNAWTWKAPQE